jgi:hypothetical protein
MEIFESACSAATPPDGQPTVKRVADIMAGVPTIGRACDALRAAGWHSSIAGNRITVDDRIFARYIGPGPFGPSEPRWLVYGGEEPAAFEIVIACDRL